MKGTNKIITLRDTDTTGVKQIQTVLNQKGFGPLAEDGIFGKETFKTVKAFQKNNSDKNGNPLIVDGKVGPLTRPCLFEGPMNRVSPALFDEVIKVAQKEIGIKEVPPGSNRGPRVEEYLNSVNLRPGYRWCAAFVYWCFRQASVNSNCINPLVRTASCLHHRHKTTGIKITMQQAILNPELIEPGDIFIIRRRGGIGHTGIVTGISDGYIQTIEGNANAFHYAEGDGVIACQRKIDTITAGFIKYR